MPTLTVTAGPSAAGLARNPLPSDWRGTAAEIQDWSNEHCWSPRKQSYTMYPGTDDPDAGVLGRPGPHPVLPR